MIDGILHSSGGNYIGQGTNNIAEIKAVEHSLDLLLWWGFNEEAISIYTDSQYVIGLFSKGWKAKKNIVLVGKVKERLKDFTNITFIWVKGHSGDKYNDMADGFAKAAIDSQS